MGTIQVINVHGDTIENNYWVVLGVLEPETHKEVFMIKIPITLNMFNKLETEIKKQRRLKCQHNG